MYGGALTREARPPSSVPSERRHLHLVAYTDAEAFGGAEQCLGTLLAFLDPGIDVTVLGTSAAIVEAVAARRPGAHRAVVPPARDKWSLRPIVAQLRAMRQLRPDVCHVNLRTPYACQYGLLAALLTRGTRVVAVEHLPLHSESRLRRWFKRRTSRRLAAHVAVGEHVARLVEHDAGLPVGSIAVIRNGVPARRSDLSERLAQGPVVGSVGRLARQKGFDVLIDALALLPGVTAVVVGDGEERASLERQAHEIGVSDRFRVTGWTDRVESFLGGFDVFVLPSRFEGFPLVALEAMQAGLAIVATDVGSVAEAVANEETGLLVGSEDPASLAAAIQRLIDDSVLRRRLGERGREVWAAQFDAVTMASAYEALYGRLTS